MRIFLVRHGETDANIQGIIQGSLAKFELNERGFVQAKRLAARLASIKFNRIFSSDLLRAKQTCEEICKYQECPMELSELLRERNFGELEEQSSSDYLNYCKTLKEPELYQPSGGESMADVRVRAASLLELIKDSSGEILLVSHGGFNRAFINFCIGESLNQVYKIEQENCCVNEIIFEKHLLEVRLINCTKHLFIES